MGLVWFVGVLIWVSKVWGSRSAFLLRYQVSDSGLGL
jgi:hypothetical protein